MRAEIETITPARAKELLKMNVGNRRLKTIKNAYVGQMLNGEWKENGEPIIIDTNGFIKDGQHRLNAVIEANFSYTCPVIYDVNTNVMDTIDTGTNRSLSDVLELNGFTYFSHMAALIKGILVSEQGRALSDAGSSIRSSKSSYISNGKGLEFANEHKDGLLRIIKIAERVSKNQIIKIIGIKDLGVILYMVGGFDFNEKHVDFIKKISGVIVDESSATAWLYKKVSSAKINHVNIKSDWKRAAIIRVWNIFANGDVPVKSLRINVEKVEEISKL